MCPVKCNQPINGSPNTWTLEAECRAPELELEALLRSVPVVGSDDEVVVEDAGVKKVNGIYKKAEHGHDGIAAYHKEADAPEGMVYALFRDTVSRNTISRKWVLGLVSLTPSDADNYDGEIFYCTRAPVESSEQEILLGLGDWNLPARYEWRAVTADDYVGDENAPNYGSPPQVREHIVDVDAESVPDASATDLPLNNIVEPLAWERRGIRLLMRNLLHSGRLQLHQAQSNPEDLCPVCLDAYNLDSSDGVVVVVTRSTST